MSIRKLQDFWERNDQKILVFWAIILTAIVSFQAGRMKEGEITPTEIKLSLNQTSANNPSEDMVKTLGQAMQRKGVTEEHQAGIQVQVDAKNEQEKQTNCTLVGSKNSDKFHLSNCSYASKIKPENRVCFPSDEKALGSGYKPAQCCHK